MNKSSIQSFLRNYSIETTVPQAQRVERFADLVPLGTRLYIAHIPGTDFGDTVALAARLRREGMEPVPHVVGRRIATRAVLEDFLKRLSGEAAVKQALVVAGDNSDPAGAIAANAGQDGGIVAERVAERKGNEGYNAATDKYEDLVKAGVIDPTKVTRTALQNAASVATLLLTSDALIAEAPKKDKKGGGGHGHGGMDDMY